MNEFDDEPLFPDQWNWQQYEAGIRQLTRQIAAAAETPDPYRKLAFETPRAKLSDYESVKLNDWIDRASMAGDLPTAETISKLDEQQRSELDHILRNRVAFERLRIRGAQMTLTFFGCRPKPSQFGNASEGKLIPRNDDPASVNEFPVHGNGPDRGNDGGRSR